MKIVDEDPKEFGYEFGRWTAARLAEHLEKETGIKLSIGNFSTNAQTAYPCPREKLFQPALSKISNNSRG